MIAWIKIVLAIGTLGIASGCALAPAARERVSSDLERAALIQGSDASPLHRKIFGDHPLDGADYARYFATRIKQVEGEGVLWASCHGATACADGNSRVRVSEQYATTTAPSLVRLSLLVHEARHTDGSSHERCPSSLRDSLGQELHSPYGRFRMGGLLACDSRADGPYGIQYVMLKNIQRYCDTCDTSEKLQAGEFADFVLNLVVSAEERARLTSD